MKVKSWRKKVVLLWEAGEHDQAKGFYRRIVDQYDSPDAPSVVKIVVRGS